MERPEVSVVLPCRNEEAAIGQCVLEIRRFLEQEKLQGEILVADNASTDRSAEIAGRMGARVVREEKPGYGYTLRAGIAAAAGEIIFLETAIRPMISWSSGSCTGHWRKAGRMS